MTTDPKTVNIEAPLAKDYYTALHRAALTFSSSLELDQVLQHIVETVTAAMQVKAAAIRLLDPLTDQLVLGAVYGLSPDYLDKGPVEVSHSPLDSETLCCYPVYVPFLSVLASLAALAIENARMYESMKDSYSGVVAAFWGTYQPS